MRREWRSLVMAAASLCLVSCGGEGGAAAPQNQAASVVRNDPPSSTPQRNQTDSGASACTAPDGGPYVGPVDALDAAAWGPCGPYGKCVEGPFCTPGGCVDPGVWVCMYS